MAKGEIKITKKRIVKEPISRTLGAFLVIGAGIPFMIAEYGAILQLALLVIVIIVGLVTSEKMGTQKTEIQKVEFQSGDTSEKIKMLVRKNFPLEQHDEVVNALNQVYTTEYHRESVQKTILEMANGDMEKVKEFVKDTEQAGGDFRDIYGILDALRPKKCKGKNHSICNGQVRQKWNSDTKETTWICIQCGGQHEYETLVKNNLLDDLQLLIERGISTQTKRTYDSSEFCIINRKYTR